MEAWLDEVAPPLRLRKPLRRKKKPFEFGALPKRMRIRVMSLGNEFRECDLFFRSIEFHFPKYEVCFCDLTPDNFQELAFMPRRIVDPMRQL